MQQDPNRRRMRLSAWALLGLLALSAGILLLPMPRITSVDDELSNLLHAPCFAVLALICCASWPHVLPRRPIVVGIAVWLLLSGLGLLSEWLQGFVARSPSWNDVAANVAGAAAGVLWFQSRVVQRSAARRGLRVAALTLIFAASIDPTLAIYEYYQQSRAMPVLASFERRRELQHWTVNDSRVSRTQRPVSDGTWSMRLEMFPARWPGAALRPARDWSGYHELVFEAWLAETEIDGASDDQELDLIVKVADAAHNGETEDRFHKTVRLSSGRMQTIRIRLSEIRTAPASREMDLTRIVMLQFFIRRPQEPRTIWVDNIRLE